MAQLIGPLIQLPVTQLFSFINQRDRLRRRSRLCFEQLVQRQSTRVTDRLVRSTDCCARSSSLNSESCEMASSGCSDDIWLKQLTNCLAIRRIVARGRRGRCCRAETSVRSFFVSHMFCTSIEISPVPLLSAKGAQRELAISICSSPFSAEPAGQTDLKQRCEGCWVRSGFNSSTIFQKGGLDAHRLRMMFRAPPHHFTKGRLARKVCA